MLSDLQIKNFAIIDDLHISFPPGLSILSGETGTGKSIILGAINLVLGGRASSDLIRTGEQEAVVEALFDLSDAPLFRRRIEAKGIVPDPSNSLLIKRLISRDGKNKVFINGSLSVLAILTDITEALLTISGQHEHQELLSPQNHLEMLDHFGGLLQERMLFREHYFRLQSLKKECEILQNRARQESERQELIQFQAREIEDAHLIPDEEEELRRERTILQNASELIRASNRIYETAYGADQSLVTELSRIVKELQGIGEIDPSLRTHCEAVNTAVAQIEDVAFSLRDYGQHLQFDPQRLEEIENRLDVLHRLKRKYGPTIADVLTFQKQILEEHERFSHASEQVEHLQAEYAALRKEVEAQAAELSRKRKKAAQELCRHVERELTSLGMKDTRFEARFTESEPPTLDDMGFDRMEFFFSPNPGEELKPLSRIASGGELSRVLLAFRHIFAREGGVATLIFDEVDAGIGGATAEVVGEKLYEIAAYHQTICITHLPQIAVYGDTHYAITKKVIQGRTRTEVRHLTADERIEEIARMLGGQEITRQTQTLAREMLQRTNTRKRNPQ
ncbi:MAG TPA: DNA repair protein RecN [Thermodesulfobacteriota bacterium]|nr:DNA repair protein RecN [Thermodesulfobacteriota bacterium]